MTGVYECPHSSRYYPSQHTKTRLIFTCRILLQTGLQNHTASTSASPSITAEPQAGDHATLECRDIRQVTTSTRTRTAESAAPASVLIRASASPPVRPSHAHRPGPAAGRGCRVPSARDVLFVCWHANRRATSLCFSRLHLEWTTPVHRHVTPIVDFVRLAYVSRWYGLEIFLEKFSFHREDDSSHQLDDDIKPSPAPSSQSRS